MSVTDQADESQATDFEELFDQTLGQHLVELIGTRVGIDGLVLNLTTITCMILLAEQATDGGVDDARRYTVETLIEELNEIEMRLDDTIQATIEDMVEKGYADKGEDDRLEPKKPTISMTSLLDQVFPKMPGMNLVAYFLQTIAETKSGRKDRQAAIDQFNQTLTMHGVALGNKTAKKPKTSTQTKNGVKKPVGTAGKFLRPAKTKRSSSVMRATSSNVFSVGANNTGPQIKKVAFGPAALEPGTLPETAPETASPVEDKIDIITDHVDAIEVESSEMTAAESEIQAPDAASADGAMLDEKRVDSEIVTAEKTEATQGQPSTDELPATQNLEEQNTEKSQNVEQNISEPPAITQEPPDVTDDISTSQPDDIVETTEDAIESRIVEFEENLAMQCPLCKEGRIIAKETSRNKLYYQCLNKTCNLISWGKPYHRACPACRNPFLVEAVDAKGQAILKCPRATCRHRQSFAAAQTVVGGTPATNEEPMATPAPKGFTQKPKRKVVRRRVVRKRR
jgi:hypothetical protein